MSQTFKTPTLVLLSGWGFRSEIFQNLINRLQEIERFKDFNFIAFGFNELFSGIGQQHPIQISSSAIMSYIAKKILDQVPEQCVWLGWSLGGVLVQWIAIHHPERVKMLINISATPRFLEDREWNGTSLEKLENFTQKLDGNISKTLKEFALLNLHPKVKKQDYLLLKKFLIALPQECLDTLKTGLDILKNCDLRRSATDIKCPALFIFGEKDVVLFQKTGRLSKIDISSQISYIIPHANYIFLKNQGHVPFLFNEEQFINSVLPHFSYYGTCI